MSYRSLITFPEVSRKSQATNAPSYFTGRITWTRISYSSKFAKPLNPHDYNRVAVVVSYTPLLGHQGDLHHDGTFTATVGSQFHRGWGNTRVWTKQIPLYMSENDQEKIWKSHIQVGGIARPTSCVFPAATIASLKSSAAALQTAKLLKLDKS